MCPIPRATDGRYRKAQFFVTMTLGLIAFFLTTSCFAQSPPLGPPNETVDKFDVAGSVLIDLVQHQVQTTIDTTNANLKAQGKGARVSALPTQSWPPYR